MFDSLKNAWVPVSDQVNSNKGYVLFKAKKLGKYGIVPGN
jgi:hypothetical protein